MQGSSNKFFAILSVCLISIGLLANQWVLAYLLAPGGIISPLKKVVIFSFDVFFISTGVFVFIRREVLDRKKFIFSFSAIAIIIFTIEIFLHIVSLVIDLGNEKDIANRFLLSPYKDKEWVKGLSKELGESSVINYKQFLGWGRKEYSGEYVNINSQGARITWNPVFSHGKPPNTVYVFGGSTIWGTGVRDDYTIPSCLSKLFNRDGYDFVVYNYGESGYTFTQEIIHLILLLRDGHKPDYVLFYDGVNDVYGAYQSGVAGTTQNFSEIGKKLFQSQTPIQQILIGVYDIVDNYSMIYRTIMKIPAVFSPQLNFQEVASGYNDQELQQLADGVVDYYAQSLNLLDHLAQTYGFKYACFWQPVIFTENKLTDEETTIEPRLEDKALCGIYKNTNNALMATAPPHFFNISDALRDRQNTYYTDFCHLSEEGNEVVAAKIFEIFEKEFLLNLNSVRY